MATIYNHIRTSGVDDNGNVNVVYPETTGSDVTVDRQNNQKIPASATDAQKLANNLSSAAFTSIVDDTSIDTDSAWSSEKIDGKEDNISLRVGADNGLHFTNSNGDDYILDLTKAVGTAGVAQVLSGYTFSNSSKLGLNGSMTDNGHVSYTLNPGETQTIPQGYHDGTGTVSVSPNTGTYTYPVGSTGSTVDMGDTNTYRYVNAENVYNKGKVDGTTVHTGTYTIDEETEMGTTVDMGASHTYRYISVPAGGSAIDPLEITYKSTSAGTFGGFSLSKEIVDKYKYITLSDGNGYVYFDNYSSYQYIGDNVKTLLSSLNNYSVNIGVLTNYTNNTAKCTLSTD